MPPIDPKHGFWEMAAASIIDGLLSTETHVESNLELSQIRGRCPPPTSRIAYLLHKIECVSKSNSSPQ